VRTVPPQSIAPSQSTVPTQNMRKQLEEERQQAERLERKSEQERAQAARLELKRQQDEIRALEKAQRQQRQQEIVAQQVAAKANAKAERQARHEEMLKEHALRREERKRKALEVKEKNDELKTRELSITFDVNGLKDALHGYLSKFGTAHTQLGQRMWSFRVNYEEKEALPKALQEPLLEIPVRVVLEQVPIPHCSVTFPYLWVEDNKKGPSTPTGTTPFELKNEILTVFSSKLPAWAKPHFVTFRSGVTIVTLHTTEARDEAVRITATGNHNWVIRGKQVPSLQAYVQTLKRKRGEQK